MSKIISDAWFYHFSKLGVEGKQLLLTNPKNKDRILNPSEYSTWLNTHFADLFPCNEVHIGDKRVSSNYDAEDYLIAVSRYLLHDSGCLEDEEFRYHYGLAPSAMDGKHYAGFDSPSEVAAIGERLDVSIARICGGVPTVGKSTKAYKIVGKPGQISHVCIEMDIEAYLEFSENDLLVKMSAHGFDAFIELEKREGG